MNLSTQGVSRFMTQVNFIRLKFSCLYLNTIKMADVICVKFYGKISPFTDIIWSKSDI